MQFNTGNWRPLQKGIFLPPALFANAHLLPCIASYDYELAGRLPLQRAREILTELKRQMAGEGESHG